MQVLTLIVKSRVTAAYSTLGRLCAVSALVLGFTPFSVIAQADAYPNKPVRMLVAFAPGGSTDVLARAIAQKLSESIGAAVIIDNRPGANGTLGSDLAAKAAPDGYTIMLGEVGSLAMAPSLYPKLPYDPGKDFVAISLVARTPLLAAVRTDSPFKTYADLLKFAKANPGKLNYPSSGAGGPNHFAGELFNQQAGVKTLHIPYKGGGPAVLSLVTGETDFGLLSRVTIDAQLQGGRLRPLAVASEQRLASMPTVLTMAEAGLPGFVAETWFMMVAPAGTPRPVVDKLRTAIAKIVPDAVMKEKLNSMGAFGIGDTPEQASSFLKAEIAKWSRVAKSANITID